MNSKAKPEDAIKHHVAIAVNEFNAEKYTESIDSFKNIIGIIEKHLQSEIDKEVKKYEINSALKILRKHGYDFVFELKKTASPVQNDKLDASYTGEEDDNYVPMGERVKI